jgi:DNA-binding transcriptional LysR family regulator
MFRRGTSLLAGRLRVDMPTLVARRVVLPRLGEFLSAHPNLEIEISSTDRRVDLVREGFDCVLRIGGLADSQLIARTLGLTPVVNCASPAYLAQYGTPRTLDDLAAHRIVHYVQVLGARSAGFEYLDHADATGSPVTQYVPMAGAVTVNNADAYEAAALGGLGIIQAPATGVRHDLGNGRLVALLPEFTAAPMPVSLLYASRQVPERVRVFMDWLAELIEADLD